MARPFEDDIETPEMENLSSLSENIVYRLPGCSDVMIRKTIQEVYRDFCRRACCLSARRHFTLTSEGEISTFPVFGGVIDCIAEVRHNSRVLGRRDYVVCGGKVSFVDRLVPSEGCEESQLPRIDIVQVEMPKIGSEDIPSFFMQKFGDAVVSGVLARLMSMTGKPWSDRQQADEERVRYENAVCESRLRYYARGEDGDVGRAIGNDELL